MTTFQIFDTHPFAVGMAAGVILTFCTLLFSAVFLHLLGSMKERARESARTQTQLKPEPHPILPKVVHSPDSRSVS